MIELWQAVDKWFNSPGAAELRAALIGGLHNMEAPQSVSFPYGVFHLISDVPDHFASGKNYLENCLLQFNLFSKMRTMAEALNIYRKLKSCFDFLIMPVDNFTVKSCVRENMIPLRAEGVWQINVVYRLFLEPL